MNSAPDPTGYAAVVDLPFGRLGVRMRGDAVVALDRLQQDAHTVSEGATPAAQQIVEELLAYVRDPTGGFAVLLAPRGTPFQQRVWQALRAIPVGRVLTYGALARQLGSAPRAVGQACRRNPIPVIVPCHRVVAVGNLGGYGGAVAGPGMKMKSWLLQHEGAIVRCPDVAANECRRSRQASD